MLVRKALLTLITSIACVTSAQAQDVDWINPAGGSFNDPANWNPAVVPSPKDSIRFDLPDAYEVTEIFFDVARTTVAQSDLRILLNDDDGAFFGDLGILSVLGSTLDFPGSLTLSGKSIIGASSLSIGSSNRAARLIFDSESLLSRDGPLALQDAGSLEFRRGGADSTSSQLTLAVSFNKLDGSFTVDTDPGITAPILGSRHTLIRIDSSASISLSDFPFVVTRPRPGRTFELSLSNTKSMTLLESTTAVSDSFASTSLAESDELGDVPTRIITADLNGNWPRRSRGPGEFRCHPCL